MVPVGTEVGRDTQVGAESVHEPLELGRATVEAIASRVTELLELPAAGGMIDASAVARRYDVSRSWIYTNADELGAIRLGSGPKARLRFDPERVAEVVTSRSAGERSQKPDSRASKPRSGRRRKGQVGQKDNLLPIRHLK